MESFTLVLIAINNECNNDYSWKFTVYWGDCSKYRPHAIWISDEGLGTTDNACRSLPCIDCDIIARMIVSLTKFP